MAQHKYLFSQQRDLSIWLTKKTVMISDCFFNKRNGYTRSWLLGLDQVWMIGVTNEAVTSGHAYFQRCRVPFDNFALLFFTKF